MKKYTSIICTMAVLLMASAVTFVSCSKDEEPAVSGKFTLTVNASKGAPATKDLSLDDEHNALTASWKLGEKVYVHNNTTDEDLDGYLEAQSNGVNTVLKGSLTGAIAVDDELSLRFCSSDNYTSQQGTIEWIAENCDLATATVEVTDISTPSVTTTAAEFKNQQAIVKFTLMDADGNDLDASVLSVTVDDVIYATIPASATNVLYVALPEISEQTVTLSAKVGGQWYNKTQAGVTFVNGQYYTVAAKLAPKGMLPGTFSVDGSKKVHFSQGNLQATYDGSNWTWAFAEHQYDFIGNAAGNTSVTSTSPYISGNGTVDLFGWVGASSTWTGVAQYGITSSTATYSVDGYGNDATESLKSDWGALAISNGGNTENSGWRTLTGDSGAEWQYLFNNRSTTTSYAKATVDGKSGVILFPDVYTHPTDLTDLQSVNSSSADYTTNRFDTTDWAKMEAAGAVFLPAAGLRIGSSVTEVGTGYYWSSSPYFSKANGAYMVCFYSGDVLPAAGNRKRGYSVRLVCPVE